VKDVSRSSRGKPVDHEVFSALYSSNSYNPADPLPWPTPSSSSGYPGPWVTPSHDREVDINIGEVKRGESVGVDMQGLVVEGTRPGSKAHNLLQRGDTVTSVNGRRVSSHQEFLDELERVKPGLLRICVLPQSSGPPMPPPPPLDSEGDGWYEDLASPPEQNSEPMIVLNCEDIGRCARNCTAFQQNERNYFPWDAVRSAISFYEELGFLPQPVCHQATIARCRPPADLRLKLVQCPVIDEDGRAEGRGSDRIFVLNLAKTYGCHFVDNSNYREQVWCGQEQWPWLKQGGLNMKVEYIFDGFGEFLPSREVRPAAKISKVTAVGRLRIDWNDYGGR